MLNVVDNIVIVAAVVIIVAIGAYFSKAVTDMESYYLANRSLPWSLVVGTLMASWYGGTGVVGTIGYASVFGLASWFIWSFGAHAVRFPLALWVGPRIHIRADVTIPDMIQAHYGKFAAVFCSCLLFFYCTSIAEITATGYIGIAAWNANRFLIGLIVVVITLLLTVLGGLMGVAVTDMILFFLMVFSVCVVFPQIFSDAGGMQGIRTALASKPELVHPIAGMPFTKAAMLLGLCLNVYADPSFYQRFSASNSARTGRRAMLTCFVIWLGFDLVAIMCGVITRVLHPDAIPEVAYVHMVLSKLPQGVRALFIIGLFGAVISTLDSYYLIGGTTLAKDIYGRIFFRKDVDDKKLITLSRIGALLLGGMGLTLAFRFKMVFDAVVFLSSLWMSTAFVPVLMAIMYKGKKTVWSGRCSLVLGCLTFIVIRQHPIPLPGGLGTLEPLLAAIPVSFLAWFVGNRFGTDISDRRNIIIGG